jgi:hypothetical protein
MTFKTNLARSKMPRPSNYEILNNKDNWTILNYRTFL